MAEINDIQIKNFKSIKSLKINGCRRINLFIGRPNVGKSNIIEALSLFTTPFLRPSSAKSFTNLVRYESEPEIFYRGNIQEPATVYAGNNIAKIFYDRESGLEISLDGENYSIKLEVDDNSNVKPSRMANIAPTSIRRYIFNPNTTYHKGTARTLIPPYGYNLLNVIEQNEDLRLEISGWFEEYGLSLVFDRASQQLKILQNNKRDKDIFLIPYNSVADTLQRMVFFKTAIASSSNSVLLFEEPEAHSFPPYIAKITQEMIYNQSNQYFMATHSPFILNDFLENAINDLSVYLVDYERHETKVVRLTDKQLHEIYQNGVDLFTNSESYYI